MSGASNRSRSSVIHPACTDSVNDPEDEETECINAMGEEVDLGRPSFWRPFPNSSILLFHKGKTIGFRTRSGGVYGPEKIEVMPDIAGYRWMFRFITHEYSVPLDFQASCRVVHNRARPRSGRLPVVIA